MKTSHSIGYNLAFKVVQFFYFNFSFELITSLLPFYVHPKRRGSVSVIDIYSQ